MVPGVLTVLTCTLLGTAGWYFLGVETAYNCGMSGIGCGATARLWLAADGIGGMDPGRDGSDRAVRKPQPTRIAAACRNSCWVLLAAAVSWFLLAGRLI
jgi:hypothetical protein